jgi:hypothetical protein
VRDFAGESRRSVGLLEIADEGPYFGPDIRVDYEELCGLTEDGGDEVELCFGAAVGLVYLLDVTACMDGRRGYYLALVERLLIDFCLQSFGTDGTFIDTELSP